VQADLLGALADRGDKAARAAAVEALASPAAQVRLAAIRALGPLGDPADVAGMAQRLTAGPADERTAARKTLVRMCGDGFTPAIVAELKKATPEPRTALIAVLTERRAADSAAAILAFVADADAGTRKAAMAALGALARPEHVAAMLAGVLKAEPGPEREAAERAVVSVCNRIKAPEKRAELILTPWESHNAADQIALLPLLGRVGGARTLKIVEAAITDSDPLRRAAGLQALCNWPDASAAEKLLDLARNAKDSSQRHKALLAYARIAVSPDVQTPAARLAMLETAMSLASTAEERCYILKRGTAKTLRTVETLRFALPYVDRPECAEEACATIVELAHHRALRESSKVEFEKALDKVLAISKNADLRDRADRYKHGQTRLPGKKSPM
jgi:HEAT repeat protein